MNCPTHPVVEIRWRCDACFDAFCDACVDLQGDGAARTEVCPHCRGKVASVQGSRVPVGSTFFSALPTAFAYPFRGSGGGMLLVGAVLIFGIAIVASMFRGGVRGSLFQVILMTTCSGYLVAHMMGVITSTAEGDDETPHWPDVTDFVEDVLTPLAHGGAVLIVSSLPAIVYALAAEPPDVLVDAVFWALAGVGGFYAPMAFLGVASFGRLAALSPHIIVPAIFRVFGQYLTALVVLAALVAGVTTLGVLMAGAYPVLGMLAVAALTLYTCVVVARILGLLLRTNADRLGW